MPVLALIAAAVLLPAQASRDSITAANAALQAGEADKALGLLGGLVQSGINLAEAHNLKCRVYFTLEQWNAAVSECEQAVKLEGQNSNYHLWLGRALGEKASAASFLSAYSLAKRVRAEFETAVQLDPRSPEALTALGDFYQSAPGVVGGGLTKAEGIAGQLEKIDPAHAHELRGRIGEDRRDYGTADRELRQAIASSAHPALQWMILASYFERRQSWTEMEAAIRGGASAAEHDKHAGVALFNGASILMRTSRDVPLAAKMLEKYLATSIKDEEAPAFVAHEWLAQLKEKQGDADGARQQHAAALAMAHDYKPARDSRH